MSTCVHTAQQLSIMGMSGWSVWSQELWKPKTIRTTDCVHHVMKPISLHFDMMIFWDT